MKSHIMTLQRWQYAVGAVFCRVLAVFGYSATSASRVVLLPRTSPSCLQESPRGCSGPLSPARARRIFLALAGHLRISLRGSSAFAARSALNFALCYSFSYHFHCLVRSAPSLRH